jgi:Mg-chelatase subunit ChlI
MRRLVKWTAGIVGIAALARLVRRHRSAGRAPDDSGFAPDPAADLREKLAETRDVGPEAASESVAGESDEPASGSLDERRARVHEKAQQAIDTMSDGDA